MREGGGGHLNVIVSADRMCQLGVNDGGWDVTFSYVQVLGWRVDPRTGPSGLVLGTCLR